MASLNLSINGPSIRSSYQAVINASIPSSSSSTYGHWALFSVQAPLMNAFQDGGSKESVLKVETTGDGELSELVEDFSEGRIQFALVKVKDPNSGLPKNVLIAWCGGGVPERTKGYFTSHLAAVSKLLHGYHVQITARSDADLVPEAIVSKVADASGARYTAGGAAPIQSSGPPPLAKKPVFTPTASTHANPLVTARNRRQMNVDEDGWGADAPPVTRTQIEKVQPAYTPVKVNMAELVKSRDDSRSKDSSSDGLAGHVGGGYQPVGKVDIAAIRARARDDGKDSRPTIVKGAYEPVGKVDIAAIRARAQRPGELSEDAAPKNLAGQSAAFSQSERLTQLPKPKVAKKFGGASAFTGTKAPTPGGLGFGAPAAAAAAVVPVGSASRTFADQGGKTPAQLWAEKKGLQTGGGVGSAVSPPMTSPVAAQKSGGEWRSGYSGKSWAPVQMSNFGRGGAEGQETGESEHENPVSPAAGVSAIRDRFRDTTPMGATASSAPRLPTAQQEDQYAPPPLPLDSRPSGPSGGFALPGLPSRPPPAAEEESDEDNKDMEAPSSPVRIVMPVSRGPEPRPESPSGRLPTQPTSRPEDLPREHDLPSQEGNLDPRATAMAVVESTPNHAPASAPGGSGKRAVVQYDYDKDEDNEIDLREGEQVTNIEMVDENWWMGTNSRGESGLFPSNYVELADNHAPPAPVDPPASASTGAAAAPGPEEHHDVAGDGGRTATAQFDYEAAEDNELSFPEGAVITNLEFPDGEWWFGHHEGASGLFPASYVELNA